MSYKDLQIFYKYLYNKMDLYNFSVMMKDTIHATDNKYIEEKWQAFQRDLFGFIIQDISFFNWVKEQIFLEDYKG